MAAVLPPSSSDPLALADLDPDADGLPMIDESFVRALKSDLLADEGVKLRVYLDTESVPTIGVGRNIRENGISYAEAMYLLDNDINSVCRDLDRLCPWWRQLSEPRRRALANLRFQLGQAGLMQFKKMLAAMQDNDFLTAAMHLRD